MRADDPRSDDDLIGAANAGDADAFAALYHRHRDFVVRVARRLVACDADALDVLHDAFLYLLGKFPGFVLTGSLRSLLFQVARNLALQRRRRARRGTELADEPIAPPVPAAQADRELAAALAGLPEARAEVVWLRFHDGLSLQEIAEALDVPLGTVKSRLHDALAQLRDDPRARVFFLP